LGLQDDTDEENDYTLPVKIRSVKSVNPFESVVRPTYDIIKAHVSEIKVETDRGNGGDFIIQLPGT